MRHLQQTCLKFPLIEPSEKYVEQKPPGLSLQIFGDGAEKFVAEMMVMTLIKLLLINIRHRLHYHQQPPEDPKSSIIADGDPRQVFWKKPQRSISKIQHLRLTPRMLHVQGVGGENCLMVALFVPPFSYPHHSPQHWYSLRVQMGTHCAGLRSNLIACSTEFKTPSFNINEPITTSEVTTRLFHWNP
ncbi:hypothetical protein K443DRAFT_685614, partial [Laccaria amethystina LaAM-08-1]